MSHAKKRIKRTKQLTIYHHEDMNLHKPLYYPPHQENPNRVNEILEELQSWDKSGLQFKTDFPHANESEILKVHSKTYIRSLRTSDPKMIDDATYVSKHSLNAAKLASGAVLNATQMALNDANNRTFCVVRPPGHHAMHKGIDPDAKGIGFCLLNHVAIAAASVEQEKNIAIVDFDIHHGNGTEEFVSKQNGSNIKYFSIHLFEKFEDPDKDFFPGSGKKASSEKVINLPIKPIWAGGRGREDFKNQWNDKLIRKVKDFSPNLLLISAGFDGALKDEGCIQDGKIGMDLSPMDFYEMTKSLMEVISEDCGVVSMLEGGYGSWDEDNERYDYSTLRLCVKQHCRALLE